MKIRKYCHRCGSSKGVDEFPKKGEALQTHEWCIKCNQKRIGE